MIDSYNSLSIKMNVVTVFMKKYFYSEPMTKDRLDNPLMIVRQPTTIRWPWFHRMKI